MWVGRNHELRKYLQELTSGLNHLYQTWKYVFDEAKCQPYQLDSSTVTLLQGLCPAQSVRDTTRVMELFTSGRVFPSITKIARLLVVRQKVMEIPHLIPSMKTFFENTKFLMLGAKSLHVLLGNAAPGERSLSRRLLALYNPGLVASDHMYGVQPSIRQNSVCGHTTFRIAYLQLWLFALQHYPELQAVKGRKNWSHGRLVQ